MRSQEQIKKEIEALKEIKPKVRHYTAFGDDNHAVIDAQLWVLEWEIMDEDAVYDEFPEDKQSRERDGALEAVEWLNEQSEEDSLVESWRSLVKE